MENRSVYDVQTEQYATVIRELIRHENDVTNHRIMWLLIVQGLLFNAYVNVRGDADAATAIALAGILVTLSAFVMLYKGYQARGYLHFLGDKAKRGKLREEHLRLDGWPRKRIKGWRRERWVCSVLERAGHLMEPYLFLPVFLVTIWMFCLLRRWTSLPRGAVFVIAFILSGVVLSVMCILWVRSQKMHEEVLADEEAHGS